MTSRLLLQSLLLGAPLAAAGCAECAREGCDALTRHAASSTEARVAGVVASESDVVANGCQECGFAAAGVTAWPVEQEALTQQDVARATASAPQVSTEAGSNGRFALALSPGLYVVCVTQSCFNVETMPSTTTTLNVKLINGVSSAFTGPPGGELRRVEGLFRL